MYRTRKIQKRLNALYLSLFCIFSGVLVAVLTTGIVGTAVGGVIAGIGAARVLREARNSRRDR